MYLPNKITNILSKITKSYTVKYTNGKIESVFINEKDVMIQASNKGYCIYLKGGPIYLNDLKSNYNSYIKRLGDRGWKR